MPKKKESATVAAPPPPPPAKPPTTEPELVQKLTALKVQAAPADQGTAGDGPPKVVGETSLNMISLPGTSDQFEEEDVVKHAEVVEKQGEADQGTEANLIMGAPPAPTDEEGAEEASAVPSSLLPPPDKKESIKQEICVPEKPRKPRPAKKVKPWYLQKKPDPLEKRQDSRIAFIMPKQEDPQVIALRKTNKMVQKLIKYLRKSWKVRINRKQTDRELEFRMLTSVYTSKPDDWLEQIRDREARALETGYFSAMDIPYDSLIDLELDTALLTFKNLPPDLKITAARWIRMKLRKEELKRKRDAYLPRLSHGRTRRPSYNKGRLLKDPGGVKKVDQFVRVAEGFQRVTKGSKPYSKVLNEWSQNKEKENYNTNSGFGVVRDGMFDFRKEGAGAGTSEKVAQGNINMNKDDMEGGGNGDRRVSIVDARKYQRDMLYYEKMLAAIYNIVMSLLNIKAKQLESKFPLPPSAVLQLRASNHDSTESRRKSAPHLLQGRKTKMSTTASHQHKSLMMNDHSEFHPSQQHNLLHPHGHIRKSLANLQQKKVRSGEDLKSRLSMAHPNDLKPEDVINLSPVRSTQTLVQDIMKHHTHADMLDVLSKRKTTMTAEEKIKRLVENPEHAAIRRARNYMTYVKLFERNKKLRKPVWHDIDIAAMTMDFNEGLAGKDPAHLTEADAAEVVELALQKRRSLAANRDKMGDEEETAKRWPEETDIPTPTYPFPSSNIRIPSEEQSRQNLLKKTPHMDEVPSTPVRRLYKLAGVRTTEADIFSNIMEMKKMFRVTENKCRVYYENEIGKLDWDTQKRFREKLRRIVSTPVYQWTIAMMRDAQDAQAGQNEDSDMKSDGEEEDREQKKPFQKRTALWYKKLQEEAEINGATRHNGCHTELQKLLKYCDVDMKTKPHMLNRLALLVVSLPTTELATKQWQQGVVFLLEFMFGTPPELIHDWLNYRGLPYLL